VQKSPLSAKIAAEAALTGRMKWMLIAALR